MIKKSLREEKAVTLTALVITIIVLIILAAISVLGVFGENGIFKSAITAKVDTETAAYREELKAIEVQTRTQEMKSSSEFVYLEAFKTNVKAHSMFAKAQEVELKSDDTILRIVTEEGYVFYITDEEIGYGGINGEFEEVKDLEVGKNVTFTYDDTVWTNKPIPVTITLDESITQQLQYSTNGKTWINMNSGETVKAESNGYIYARLYNGIGGGVAKAEITHIDTLKPNQFVPTIYTTDNSITVSGVTTDAKATKTSGSSGIASYEFSKDGGEPFVKGETALTTEYTFNGLTTGETYSIVMRVTDNAGNVMTTNPVKRSTVPIPDISDGSDGKKANLTINCNPSTYTNGKVKVAISTTENLETYGFKLEYSLDDGATYTEYTKEFEVEDNGMIYVAVSNGHGAYGNAFRKEINWIDRLVPINVTATVTDKTSSTLTVKANAEDAPATEVDASSGIKAYKYSCDGGTTWTEEIENTTYTFTKLKQNTEYKIQVRAFDNAGNKKDSKVISGLDTTTDKVPPELIPGEGGTIEFVYSKETWTNEDVKVTLNIKEEIKEAYTVEWKTDEKTVWSKYTESSDITLTRNGKIYVRLTEASEELANTEAEITWIDKLKPVSFKPEIKEMTEEGIIVTASTKDEEAKNGSGKSGISKYIFSIYDGSTLVSSNEVSARDGETVTYTYRGLTEGTTYTINVVAEDKAGNKSQVNDNHKLDPIEYEVIRVPSLKEEGAVKFESNPKTWTKGTVTVSATISKDIDKTGYILQYSRTGNESEWTPYTEGQEVEYTKNGVFYVRLYDTTKDQGGYAATINIANIDKLSPNERFSFITPVWSENSITVKAVATDRTATSEYGKSGIARYFFSIDGGDWVPENETGVEGASGYYTFTGLNDKTEYTIKAKAVDKAGNEQISSNSINKTTGKFKEDDIVNPAAGEIRYSYNPPKGAWIDKVAVTLTAKDSTYTNDMWYSTDLGKNWTNYTGAFTVNQNGIIIAHIITDDYTSEDYYGYISWIDSEAPTIISLSEKKATVNTVTVEGLATDSVSGVAEYYFTYGDFDDTNTTKTVKVDNATRANPVECTLTGLTQNQNHIIRMKAKDIAGNISEERALTIHTEAIPVLNVGSDVTFDYSPAETEGWTQETVTATLKLEDTANIDTNLYKLQYLVEGSGEWKNYNDTDKIKMTQNGKIWVRLSLKDESQSGIVNNDVYGEVTWIDNDDPVINNTEIKATSTSIKITIDASDVGSGIRGYSINRTSRESGWSEIQESPALTLSDLDTETSYNNIRIKVIDKVGNETVKQVGTITTGKKVTLQQGEVNFDATGYTGWQRNPYYLGVEYNGAEDISNYELVYSWDNFITPAKIYDKNYGIEVSKNGTINIGLMEADGSMTSTNISYNIKNYDDIKPEIVSAEGTDIVSGATATITVRVEDKIDAEKVASKVSQYCIYENDITPSNGSAWVDCIPDVNGEFEIEVNPTKTTKYYIWVKDNAGNISKTYKECTIVVEQMVADGTWSNFKGVNTPQLMEGMTAVVFDENGNAVETEDYYNWYDYSKQKWANAVTKDKNQNITGYWVWIPRYAYKIENNRYTSTAGTISVKFLVNDSDYDNYTDYFEDNTEKKISHTMTDTTSSTQPYFIVHPAFTDGTYNNFMNGEWDAEIPGFWVAKYEAGYQQNTLSVTDGVISSDIINSDDDLITSNLNYTYNSGMTNAIGQEINASNYASTKISYPVFLPLTYGYNRICIGDMYGIAKDIKNARAFYGLRSEKTDSHMMKNSEWGAVAYLSYSVFGTSGVSIGNNSYYNTNYKTNFGKYSITCMSVKQVDSSNTDIESFYFGLNGEGVVASCTGNSTGIYDLVGGLAETTSFATLQVYVNGNLYGNFNRLESEFGVVFNVDCSPFYCTRDFNSAPRDTYINGSGSCNCYNTLLGRGYKRFIGWGLGEVYEGSSGWSGAWVSNWSGDTDTACRGGDSKYSYGLFGLSAPEDCYGWTSDSGSHDNIGYRVVLICE